MRLKSVYPLMKLVSICCVLIGITSSAMAQVGGRGVYDFLNVQAAPRLSALGSNPVPIFDQDPNIGFYLPSQLSYKMDRHLAFNYVNYFSDINIGQVNYARSIDSAKTMSFGLLYTNYGKFDRYDEGGNSEGTFNAADYALQFGYGKRWNRWSAGLNSKFILSQLESYVSTGLAFDGSLSYTADSGLFTSSLLFRNAGFQLTSYNGTRENLPFEVQMAFSHKLKHAPFRLIMVLHHLNVWEIAYINTNDRTRTLSFDNADQEERIGFGDNLFRHMILATEMVFSPNFMLRASYNHQRRQEMTWTDAKGLAGFNFGVGIKIKRLRFDYSSASFFPGKSGHSFALTLNLREFKKK
ncbi:MAG: type IX secretion system protein PorQ [Bacteroidetes bacterium]|nr:MAG: type IX secretion system protein PorQ [Bacteroidota bacterium]